MDALPTPSKEAILYEDDRVYVCLASYPMTRGHTVVVWKGDVKDINSLSCDEYDYLMDIVDVARDTLLEALNVEKVYLLYMDEVKDVHWHLVPRYDEKGFNVFIHTPSRTTDFSLAEALQPAFRKTMRRHREFASL